MNTHFEINIDWLNKYKTKLGGYTKLQIQALGLTWPLTKGWKALIAGNYITLVAKENFEYYAEKPNKKQVKSVLTIDNCIAYLFKNKDKLNLTQEYKISNIRKNFTN